MAAKNWGVSFPQLADPSCTLVALMNARGWLTSVVERGGDFTAGNGFMAQKLNGYHYPVGMLQPGVLALRGAVSHAVGIEPVDGNLKEEASSAAAGAGEGPQVLLSWGSRPNPANKNGAANRLPAKKAWEAVQLSLGGDFNLARPDENAQYGDLLSPPWPLFYFMLMARGNFVRPAFFLMDTETAGDPKQGGRSITSMATQAMRNGAVALVGTGAGLWVAPKQTAGALALYVAYFFSPGGPYAQIQKAFPPRNGRQTAFGVHAENI